MAPSIACAEAVRLAKHVLVLDGQLKSNGQKLDELVKVSEAAPLLEEKGFRAVAAAECLVAWSHEGRVRRGCIRLLGESESQPLPRRETRCATG